MDKQTLQNIQSAEDRVNKYLEICKVSAPYPLNYLPYTHNGKGLAILIGFMMDEEVLKL